MVVFSFFGYEIAHGPVKSHGRGVCGCVLVVGGFRLNIVPPSNSECILLNSWTETDMQ